MAWTVNDGSQIGNLVSGTCKFYDGDPDTTGVLLASCAIPSVNIATADTMVFTISPAAIETFTGSKTVAYGRLVSATTVNVLTTNNITTVAVGTGDIQFDDTSWATGGTVTPGTLTINFSSITAS